MAAIRSNAGGQLLNQYLVARIFAFDDDQSEARAACVAKGWEAVRRGPAWIAYASERAAKAAAAAVLACPAEAGSMLHLLPSKIRLCLRTAESTLAQGKDTRRTPPDPSRAPERRAAARARTGSDAEPQSTLPSHTTHLLTPPASPVESSGRFLPQACPSAPPLSE